MMPGTVRLMRQADLDAVHALQCRAYAPAYHESVLALASHLAAGPGACFVWEADAGELGAYVFAHPWSGSPPLLHQPLQPAARADHLFIHDLAVCPARQGVGLAAQVLAQVLLAARSVALGHIRIVALAAAAPFWRQRGFVDQTDAVPPECYGDAVLMHRVLTGTEGGAPA